MKRVILPILCLLLLLTASGCGSILDGEVSYVEPYVVPRADDESGDEDVPVLNSDAEFAQAVQSMLTERKTDAVFRIPLPENVSERETELMDVCRSVALDTPLGAFAVYYITCRLTPIVAYCNVQVAVAYKREAEDIDEMFNVSSLRYMDSRLQSALSTFDGTLVFRTSLDELTDDYLTDRVYYLFRRSPLDAVTEPKPEVTSYPAPVGDRIMEIKLFWPYNAAVLDDMRGRMISRTDEIAGRIGNADDYVVIQTLITELNSGVTLLPAAVSVLSDSAYGFLVTRSGTQKSAALALKALCDRLNIGCYVVEGRHRGEPSWWNVVSCDGKWYHADPTGMKTSPEDGSVLFGDVSMAEDQYYWNAGDCPACPEDYLLPREEGTPASSDTPADGTDETAEPPENGDGQASEAGAEPGVPDENETTTEEPGPDEESGAGEENETGRETSEEPEKEDTP